MSPAVHRIVEAPAPVLWDLLVTVARWPDWGPSVRGVELDTEQIGLGSRGRVVTIGGLRLPFEVTAFDPGASWSWRVGGVRATDHTVEPRPGGCRVGIAVHWAAAPYLGVCALALRRLERLARADARP